MTIRARDPHEHHRVASSLELLTDLCFVVAVSQAAASLHHAGVSGHLGQGVLGFGMAFLAIWWAWLNFSWFGSAYDNDDVAYRVLTIFQIVGALVLAAGIQRMAEGDFHLGVAGYVIMRCALVVQWLRAAAGDPPRRTTCLRYAIGIFLVQVLWVGFLWVPPAFLVAAFVGFGVLELLVPIYAERAAPTTWHPHHIAERYSLFFLIVLGETILSATVAIQEALHENRIDTHVLWVVAGGVLIVFSCWWLYFSRNAGEGLEKERTSVGSYVWGFGHYFVFAGAAGIGGGLAARVDFWAGKEGVEGHATGSMVTVATSLLLAAMWATQVRPHDPSLRTLGPFAAAIALILAGTFSPVPELATGLVCVALLVVSLKTARSRLSGHVARPH